MLFDHLRLFPTIVMLHPFFVNILSETNKSINNLLDAIKREHRIKLRCIKIITKLIMPKRIIEPKVIKEYPIQLYRTIKADAFQWIHESNNNCLYPIFQLHFELIKFVLLPLYTIPVSKVEMNSFLSDP